jgi:hypothetical protein
MEFKSRHFTIHMQDLCKDILPEAMEEMIIELSANAIFVMNTELDGQITGRMAKTIVDLLKHSNYRFMPLHLVCEGFQKGAMGELGGTTRYTIRNVNTWMKAMFEKLAQINIEKKTKEDAIRRAEEERAFKQLQNKHNLYGAAFYRKLEWCHAGLISSQEYDRLTLDKIVEELKKGYSANDLVPSMIL